MKLSVGDPVETIDGPATVTALHWIKRHDFGRVRLHARFVVQFPNGVRRFYNSDQVWPYNPAMSETEQEPVQEQDEDAVAEPVIDEPETDDTNNDAEADDE